MRVSNLKSQSDSGDRGRRDTPVLNRDLEFSGSRGTAEELSSNDLVAGRYEILHLLGKGGMGFVYLVRDRLSGSKYAMKTVSAENVTERVIQRFEIEAKATSLIKHANVVQFRDFGLINGSQPFFVMDYCEGETLSEMIKSEGSLAYNRVLEIFIPICGALAHAHGQSIVHRDLKPSNIMIKILSDGQLQVKILDFGIAKVLVDETLFNSATKTGELFGSPYYMSPEQCVGSHIDQRSDIYSLGCVMFEALTGNPPFMADNPLTTMMKHQAETPTSLKEATLGREFPEDLEHVVARLLAKNPNSRYQNLDQVEHDLRLIQRGERLDRGSSGAEQKGPEKPSKMPVVALGLAFLLLGGIGAGVIVQSSFDKRSGDAKTTSPISGAPSQSPSQSSSSSASSSSLSPEIPFLPDLHDVSKSAIKGAVPKGFYSDSADARASRRHFRFPSNGVGRVGYGDEDNFQPASGDLTLNVPVSFVTGTDAGVLAGFRPDEIDRLMMRGLSIDDEATRYFRNWRGLRDLNLTWADVSDRSIENIRTLPNLKFLHIAQTHISASGLRQLKLDQLVLLDANEVIYMPSVLSSAVNLEALKLADSGLRNDDLKVVAQLPKLKVLDISGNSINDQGIQNLLPAKKLEQLWFTGCKVTPRCVQTLSKLPKLKGVTLSMTNWTQAQKNEFKRVLSKQNCSVYDEKAKAILP